MKRAIISAGLIAVALATSANAQSALGPETRAASLFELRAKALNGTTRVIVEFAEPRNAAPSGSVSSAAAYANSVRSVQQAIVSNVFAQAPAVLAASDRSLVMMDASPMFAMNVNAAELARLSRDPRVKRIHEDRLNRPGLLQSLGILNMPNAYTAGADGRGRAVAILDTGANKANEFLRTTIVSEACYSTRNPIDRSTSLCRNGAPSSTAPGSAADCPASIQGCGHGTHVSGIAAGFNDSVSPGEPRHGVAPQAGIVAIKVFSRFDKSRCGIGATQPCAFAYDSDLIRGLERVYALRNGVANRRIDAANMSLGGGGFGGFCNDSPLKPIIDKLRSVGIATVIASGNSGYIDGVGTPACIKSAVTVGASTKKSRGKPERMASYTNQGPQVDVLAPGGDIGYPLNTSGDSILSSRLGGYAFLSGTSMAAPHIAGVFAAIRSRPACRNKTVSQIETAFRQTGPLITDHRILAGYPRLKERRVNVVAVMRKIGCL